MGKTINQRIEIIQESIKLKPNTDYYHSDCVDLDDHIELAKEALLIIKELQKQLESSVSDNIDFLGKEARKLAKLKYNIEI